MLKEYIINLMDVNQEEMGRYVEKLKKLQQEYQTGQEWIVNLQKENDLEQNIFSPRIAAAGGLEKLAQAQEKQQAIEKEIEEVKKQLGELQKKEEEYKGLLRETDAQEVYLTKDEKAEKKTEPKEEKKRTGEIFDETGEKQEGANEKVRHTHSLETEKKQDEKMFASKNDNNKAEEGENGAKESKEPEKNEPEKSMKSGIWIEEPEQEKNAENKYEITTESPDTEMLSKETDRPKGTAPTAAEEKQNEHTEIAVSEKVEEAGKQKESMEKSAPDVLEETAVSEKTKAKQMMKEETDKESGAEEQHSAEKTDPPVDLAAKIREALDRKNRLMQADQENENLHKQIAQFHTMLANLYSQTELCMALMNADRNKCKSEMHKMKKMIKKYADMFEMKPLQNIQQKEKGQ